MVIERIDNFLEAFEKNIRENIGDLERSPNPIFRDFLPQPLFSLETFFQMPLKNFLYTL